MTERNPHGMTEGNPERMTAGNPRGMTNGNPAEGSAEPRGISTAAKRAVLLGVALVVAAGGGGYWLGQQRAASPTAAAEAVKTAGEPAKRKILFDVGPPVRHPCSRLQGFPLDIRLSSL